MRLAPVLEPGAEADLVDAVHTVDRLAHLSASWAGRGGEGEGKEAELLTLSVVHYLTRAPH